MFTVRFPNGQTVQYNTAGYLVHGDNGWHLYVRKDGPWVASIQPSAGAIVECTPACRVYSGMESELTSTLDSQLYTMRRSLSRAIRDEARKTSTNKCVKQSLKGGWL